MEKLPAYTSDLPDATTPVSTTSSEPESFRSRLIAGLKRILGTIWLCFAVYLFINVFFPDVNVDNVAFWSPFRCHGSTPKVPSDSQKVPLEAHVMSKCPDARDCLRQLVIPAMEQVSDLVDFDLSFIASVSNQTSAIECKHGPEECIGDILILCAANLPFPPDAVISPTTPRTPTIRSLGFANCLISSYSRIPERDFVEHCALEHGLNFEALNECASKQEDDPNGGQYGNPPLSGIALLRKSALYSEEVGVSTSCTVRLDESVWCVRDDGSWRDCAEEGEGSKPTVLADEVKRLWKERN